MSQHALTQHRQQSRYSQRRRRRHDNSINDYKPTCPVIFFERGNSESGQNQIFTIHCQKLDVLVECYVSTAIITMEGEWTNRTKDTLDCVFALPTAGTVMNVTLKIGPDRILTTAIIPTDDAKNMMNTLEQNPTFNSKSFETNNEYTTTSMTPEESNPFEQYVDELFRFPFGNVAPGDTITVQCEYLEPLDYYKKGYIVSLPLYFPPGTMIESAPWDKVVSVKCRINAFTTNTTVDCWTHHTKTKVYDDGVVVVQTGSCKPLKEGEEKELDPIKQHDASISRVGRDFELSYSVKSDKPQAHCIQETDIDDPNSGSLCIFVTPPATLNTTFGRAFFFLLDKSGSMRGEPLREAIRALNRALDRLRPSDQFNVCIFNHTQVYFRPSELVPANKEMLENCKTWISTYNYAGGGTVMDTPIVQALDILEKTDLLPFVVLITDGAVRNEREICEKIEGNKKMRSRFLTLGIGEYCNWYFLRMLAKLGRGFSDIVIHEERIYHKMDHLLRMANTPVLTDMEIGLKGDEIEIYPFPIPDLFIGAPVVIAARYKSSQCPKTIAIRGFNSHGDQETLKCVVEKRNDLPVEKIFVKQYLDLLTSDAWFNERNLLQREELEQKAIELALYNNMPSIYTEMVTFETTRQLFENEEKKMNKSINKKYKNDPDLNNKHRRSKCIAKMKNNKKTVILLAIGGTAAIAAVGIMGFGDVQATLDNVGIFSDGGDIDLDIDDCCDDCDCDADCDCDCDCIVM